MMVRQGWNGDYGRRKFDVELSEADLTQLIREAGLEAYAAELTLSERFRLLSFQAERLCLWAKARYGEADIATVNEEGRVMAQVAEALKTEIRKRLGLSETEPEPETAAG